MDSASSTFEIASGKANHVELQQLTQAGFDVWRLNDADFDLTRLE